MPVIIYKSTFARQKAQEMARFAKDIQKQKILHAKSMYVKGFDISVIAEILEVSEATVRKWAIENNFESAKQSAFIALSELRNTVLESFIELKEGRKPKIKPDEAAKYAAAFEKLSGKKQVLTYMFEAFELLTEELMKDIQTAKSKADKAEKLLILQNVRIKTDKIITKLSSEVDHE